MGDLCETYGLYFLGHKTKCIQCAWESEHSVNIWLKVNFQTTKFSDFSLIFVILSQLSGFVGKFLDFQWSFKFPDFSRISRSVVTLFGATTLNNDLLQKYHSHIG